jgi:restriction endonuclease S subunit
MRIAAQKAHVLWWSDLKRWMIPNTAAETRKLPEGWEYVRLKDLLKQVVERVAVDEGGEYKMLGVKWYGEGTFHRETVKGSSLSAAYVTPVVPDAFIYNRLFAWKQSFAVVPAEHGDCFVSNEFPQFAVDEQRLLPRYLYLFFMLPGTTETVKAYSVGSSAVSRNRFKEEELLDFEIPLPPLHVQRAIVARWRRTQEEIRDLRKRLSDRERQLIFGVQEDVGVAGKLNTGRPKVFALKWSQIEKWGVEMCWHQATQVRNYKYEVATVNQICKIGSGGTPSRRNPAYFGGTVPWVKTTEVRNEVINKTEETLTPKGLKNSSAKLYPAGSIVIAMYGQGATRGRTAKLGIEAATNQACAVLTDFDERILPDYLWHYLTSQYDMLRAMASGNNQPNLNADMIANFPVPLAPLDVQRDIVRRVEEGRAEIAREREAARRRAEEARAELEALILGVKKLNVDA